MTSRARHRPPLPDSCAGMWADADEPAWGSAAPASFWIALEQPGPWGNRAFVESRLDPDLGRRFEERCAAAGGRALLMRSTGVHRLGREECPSARRLYVSGGMAAGRPWLLTGDIGDPARVLEIPVDCLASGTPEDVTRRVPQLSPTTEAVLLLCTNARRDACCAVLGRPVALDADAERPGRIWECTHTGGHRFAPTGVVLPTGATFARLTTELAVEAVDAASRHDLGEGLDHPRHHRGLSHLSPAEQAADAYVRHLVGEPDVTALTTLLRQEDTDGGALVDVRHRDGRTWHLEVVKTRNETSPRRNSCITAPVPAESWSVGAVADQA